MKASLQIPVMPRGEPQAGPLRVPVQWTTTRFECEIKQLAEPVVALHRALGVLEPVVLRVIGAGAGPCRVAIFFTASGICAASAGW